MVLRWLLANLLDAEDVTIWKDVPGIMNADPKIYENTEIISKLSYKEAIELSNCGAKVIHPKTIKPLQNKGIPLFVRSFLYPESHGSVIRELDEKLKLPPIYINKGDQLLLTLSPRDFSFIAEEKLSRIFERSHDREDIRILKDKASVRDHDLGSALNGTDQDIAF